MDYREKYKKYVQRELKDSNESNLNDMAMGKFEVMPKLDKLCDELTNILKGKKRSKRTKPIKNYERETVNFDEYLTRSQHQFKGQIIKLKNIANKVLCSPSGLKNLKELQDQLVDEFQDLVRYVNESIHDVNTNQELTEKLKTQISNKMKRPKSLLRKLYADLINKNKETKERCSVNFNKIIKK